MEDIAPALTAVQNGLWRHTDRNPTDPAAVMDMIKQTLSAVDEAGDFTDRVIKSLDPYTPGGLNGDTVGRLEEIGNMLGDQQVERVQKWGALSFLGALAMTYDPSIHEAANAGVFTGDPAVYRAQLSGTIARSLLSRAVDQRLLDKQQQRLVESFFTAPTIASEDVAAEFDLMGLRSEQPITTEEALPEELDEEPDDDPVMRGSHISEPREYEFCDPHGRLARKMAGMDWLDGTLDPEKLVAMGRDVYQDGKRIAIVIDLTVGNTELHTLKRKLEASPQRELFWKKLTAAIVRFENRESVRRYKKGKVPTWYAANYGANDHNMVRGYFTPLVEEGPDRVPVFGLIAAFRTKAPQAQVWGLIGIKS